jgi:glyoxylase-like metal-dependent hydrolase (beta-lactamase superfamily II)
VEYEEKPDHLYADGDALPGGLRAIKLAGMWRGDHALLWTAPGGERVLFTGDILNGQLEPELAGATHFRREPGLYLGARAAYVERHANRAALKADLERLLREELDVIAGSHSRPFRDDPKARLERLIETI